MDTFVHPAEERIFIDLAMLHEHSKITVETYISGYNPQHTYLIGKFRVIRLYNLIILCITVLPHHTVVFDHSVVLTTMEKT